MGVIYSKHGIVTVQRERERVIHANVTLFDKTYSTIKVNGLEWICENLDYRWSGLSLGRSGTSSPEACYVEQNETLWGWNGRKCGLQYNTPARNYIIDTLLHDSEWRIPNVSDWCKLIDAVGCENSSKKLSKTVEWGTFEGTDDIGFSALPCGGWANPGDAPGYSYYFAININKEAKFINSYNNSNSWIPYLLNVGAYTAWYWHYAVRLCRTLT